ncbi:hypothetical protein DSM104299_01176 [Baekduia alba]|uniref:SRPBCC family protein n=1 Tax=Baekduia alba TaxID=2997333 RepID=UPI0023421F2D|nr:SRPBCC family protein [Baekduia alba]WCB92480.1 hypothetical protein DSM104299_01176 [Baekduia alba]
MTSQEQTRRSAVHHSFTIERTLGAAPARVFGAFADLDLKNQWFVAPEGWEDGPRTLDFRVGGTETSRGNPPGGPTFTYEATFQEIVPDERIVSTYIMHMDGRLISVSLTTVELEPATGGGTVLTFTEQDVYLDGGDTPEAREGGVTSHVDKLAALVDSG